MIRKNKNSKKNEKNENEYFPYDVIIFSATIIFLLSFAYFYIDPSEVNTYNDNAKDDNTKIQMQVLAKGLYYNAIIENSEDDFNFYKKQYRISGKFLYKQSKENYDFLNDRHFFDINYNQKYIKDKEEGDIDYEGFKKYIEETTDLRSSDYDLYNQVIHDLKSVVNGYYVNDKTIDKCNSIFLKRFGRHHVLYRLLRRELDRIEIGAYIKIYFDDDFYANHRQNMEKFLAYVSSNQKEKANKLLNTMNKDCSRFKKIRKLIKELEERFEIK